MVKCFNRICFIRTIMKLNKLLEIMSGGNMKKLIILFSMMSVIGYSAGYGKESKTIKNDAGSIKVDAKTYNSVAQDRRVRFVILHYTAIEKDLSIKSLTTKEVSAHYLVTDDDKDPVYNLVSEDNRSWHAGESSWGRLTNLNDSSVGIEIVNMGFTETNGSLSFYPFTDDQIKKVAVLLKDIIKRYELEPTSILAHSDIAPQRKQDPGPLFPWEELYKDYQIGMWYDDETKESFMSLNQTQTFTPFEVQAQLEKFGYKVDKTGQYDKQTQNVIRAFQFHFRPSNYDGIMDSETYAILQALNLKYKSK